MGEDFIRRNQNFIQIRHTALRFRGAVPIAGSVKAIIGGDPRSGQSSRHFEIKIHPKLFTLRNEFRYCIIQPESNAGTVVLQICNLGSIHSSHRSGRISRLKQHFGPFRINGQFCGFVVLAVCTSHIRIRGNQIFRPVILKLINLNAAVCIVHSVLVGKQIYRYFIRNSISRAEICFRREAVISGQMVIFPEAPDYSCSTSRDSASL